MKINVLRLDSILYAVLGIIVSKFGINTNQKPVPSFSDSKSLEKKFF